MSKQSKARIVLYWIKSIIKDTDLTVEDILKSCNTPQLNSYYEAIIRKD